MTKLRRDKGLPPFHLLIPAAGNASRMGMDIPKPYIKLHGKSVLQHTIEKFSCFSQLQSISIAINETHIEPYNEAVKNIQNCRSYTGNKSRKSSIYNILKDIPNVENEDVILIHDAARPMVQRADIEALLEVMTKAQAATLATPVFDTLLRDKQTINRDDIWAIQTPQAFKFGALKAAHEKYSNDDSFTDDASLMRAAGHKVEIVPSSRQNIKITTQDDLKMVEMMMTNDMETRSAMGYDVHAFEKSPSSRKFILGGVEIPHPLALAGHSDADVVLHAITDALLGTINDGDIGTHFPPSDPQWKDADSATLLRQIINKLIQRSVIIKFIDVTILAEEPKIGPHRDAMQRRIAEIIGTSSKRVSIKATTTEKLGFTGRKEGIACQVLATVQLPSDD